MSYRTFEVVGRFEGSPLGSSPREEEDLEDLNGLAGRYNYYGGDAIGWKLCHEAEARGAPVGRGRTQAEARDDLTRQFRELCDKNSAPARRLWLQ